MPLAVCCTPCCIIRVRLSMGVRLRVRVKMTAMLRVRMRVLHGGAWKNIKGAVTEGTEGTIGGDVKGKSM